MAALRQTILPVLIGAQVGWATMPAEAAELRFRQLPGGQGCAIDVIPDVSRGSPLGLVFRTSNGRNVSIAVDGAANAEVVAGDRRVGFARVGASSASGIAATRIWRLIARAKRFHLTAGGPGGLRTSRFNRFDAHAVLRRLLRSCTGTVNVDLQRRQEVALGLGPVDRQLVNWMLLRLANPRATIAEAPTALDSRSRNMLQSFSRASATAGRRYLNRALLDQLAARAGFRWFPVWDSAGSFSGGVAPVKRGEKWGLIARSGRVVVAPRFDDIRGVFDGYMPVRLGSRWGIVDRSGRLTVRPVFDDIGPCREARCPYRSGDRWGYLDPARGVAIRANYTRIRRFREGHAAVQDARGWALIDRFGRIRFRANVTSLFSPSNGLVLFVKRRRRGFLDLSGRVRISPRYEIARSFSDGLAAVRRNGLWGFIDRFGNDVIRPRLEATGSFYEGLAAARSPKNRLWGHIDRSGRWVVRPRFLRTFSFRGGIAIVRVRNPAIPRSDAPGDLLRGYVNRRGALVVPPVFQDAYVFREGLAPVMMLGRWGFLDKDRIRP